MIQFKSTTTPKSEQLLAHTLGYPKSWHVVRKCPHPILQQPNTFQDLIYSGDPQVADLYFNHTAAMEAAMRWKEEGDEDLIGDPSTPFDDDGGQMLPMGGDLVRYWEEGDEVEVYYDVDRKWHHATIVEVIEYRDDQRYTVKYTMDEGTQANVCYEKIREIKKASKKRKASSSSPLPSSSSSSSAQKSATKRSRTSMNSTFVATTPMAELPVYKTTFTPNYVADTKELQMGAKMGLPEGWAVNVRPNSRYTFHSPEGERFTSKKAVYTRLGLPLPKHGYNPLDDNSKGTKGTKDDVTDEKAEAIPIIEEGDPPWRTTNHKLLGKRIEYTFLDGVTGKGSVTGWIAETDVDKDGNPGFVSEKTKKPACLFHISMDLDCPVESQDLEEYEVEESLMKSEVK